MQIHFMSHLISPPPSSPGAKPGDKSLKYFTDRKIQKLIRIRLFILWVSLNPATTSAVHVHHVSHRVAFVFYIVCCWGTLSCSVFPLTRPSTATLVLSCMSHWICRSSLILATVCVGWLTIHFIMRPNGIMNVPYLSAVVLSVGFRRGVGVGDHGNPTTDVCPLKGFYSGDPTNE